MGNQANRQPRLVAESIRNLRGRSWQCAEPGDPVRSASIAVSNGWSSPPFRFPLMSLIAPDQTEEPKSNEPELPPKPMADVRPVVQQHGLGAEIAALARYMARTEVHTYAFSVAANTILSLFPFIVLLLTLTRNVFHSHSMEAVVSDMMKNLLPVGQDFVMRNMQLLAHPHKGTQFFSVVMLLITSTGIFLPLEVALNRVWGVRQNRSYLHNQAVSLGLAFAVGVLAMASVASTASQQTILSWIFLGHTENVAYHFI